MIYCKVITNSDCYTLIDNKKIKVCKLVFFERNRKLSLAHPHERGE